MTWTLELQWGSWLFPWKCECGYYVRNLVWETSYMISKLLDAMELLVWAEVYLDTAICFIVFNISKHRPSSLDALQNIITLSVTFSGDLTAGYFLLESKCQCYITPVTFPKLWLVCFSPSCRHTPTLTSTVSFSLLLFIPNTKGRPKMSKATTGMVSDCHVLNHPSARKY